MTFPGVVTEGDTGPNVRSPGWVEIPLVVGILFGTMYLTRRKGYSIFPRWKTYYNSYLDRSSIDSSEDFGSDQSDDYLLPPHDSENDDSDTASTSSSNCEKYPWKLRMLCGAFKIETPNTSRFRNHIHSRILQKFPFLIEMFYWVLTYLFYRFTKIASQNIFAKTGIWDVAERHGIQVLRLEHQSWMRYFFLFHELDVQHFFLDHHTTSLTCLNWAYAFIHIPGSVGFIAWYYYVAPSHSTFAVVRRTMTLMNFMAFITFIFYPCMPPRLLPETYGFVDTVRHENGQSTFMKGNYVNALAAMPSMHFGYSFCIGATFLYHSGILRTTLEKGESRKSLFWKIFYAACGVLYPTFIFVVIVATANHYILDTVVAAAYAILSFFLNEALCVFVPAEDLLLWVLRLEKPIPSTGERYRARRGKI